MSESILADITSRDQARIHASMWAIIKLRDGAQLDALAAALPEMEQATAGLELGGMFYSNNASLQFAFRKLRYHRDHAGCLCALYLAWDLYDPEPEAEAGNVRLDVTGDETWRAECTSCGALFHVQYGEMHASWWHWTTAAE